MSTHIIDYEDLTKIIFQLDSIIKYMHLNSSSRPHFQQMLMFTCNITKGFFHRCEYPIFYTPRPLLWIQLGKTIMSP